MRSNMRHPDTKVDIRLECFYRSKNIEIDLASWLVENLKILFEVNDIFVLFFDGKKNSAKKFNNVDSIFLNKIFASKELILCDEKQKIFTCLVQLPGCNTSNSKFHSEVILVFNDPLLVDLNFENKILDFSKILALKVSSDFCYVCDLLSSDYRYGINKAGLSLGLRDVYWINIFGKPFLDIIGESKFFNLPSANKTEKLGASLIMVKLDRPTENSEQQEKVKNEIGRNYFIKSEIPRNGQVLSGGALSLFRHIFLLGRSEMKVEVAENIPSFEDY